MQIKVTLIFNLKSVLMINIKKSSYLNIKKFRIFKIILNNNELIEVFPFLISNYTTELWLQKYYGIDIKKTY